jgi:hypothetical protein
MFDLLKFKKKYKKDIKLFKANLINLPKYWDAKECVLELKEADYQWRQMEWWAFYFEYKVRNLLADKFLFPGDQYDNVSFDMKGAINWDLKAHAIKSNDHKVILNDKLAMEKSIGKLGYHGEIIALCDVEYNDNDRTFQKWHTDLKGGKSNYELAREERTSVSRYRKTKAELTEIILLLITKDNIDYLDTHKQGRNSNGSPRNPKYMLDIELIDKFENYIIKI